METNIIAKLPNCIKKDALKNFKKAGTTIPKSLKKGLFGYAHIHNTRQSNVNLFHAALNLPQINPFHVLNRSDTHWTPNNG